MYDALVEACAAADADPDIRALVIRGAGDAFAAGTDIRQFAEFRSGDDGIAYENRLDAVIDRLERVTVPTIAQVHGVAAGGGCVIALACDLRVCTPDARFGVPIARTLGNCLSAANCARLIDAVGAARANDLLFTGRLIDVAEADGMGLVTRIAEPASIDRAVEELVATIAANAPLTIRAAKAALHRLAAAAASGRRHRTPISSRSATAAPTSAKASRRFSRNAVRVSPATSVPGRSPVIRLRKRIVPLMTDALLEVGH